MINHKSKIAIFGCGLEANGLYYRIRKNGRRVDYFIDNYRKEAFWGNRVSTLEEIKDELPEVFVYIPSRKYYKELKEQLTGCGLKEFDDFARGGAYDKKIVCINANCYGPKIVDCLETNQEFCRDYYIYDNTPIYSKGYDFELEKCLAICDVLLCQDLRKDNPYGERFSKDNAVSLTGPDCKRIIIPNLVGLGEIYYPQAYVIEGESNNETGLEFGIFPQGDRVVDRLYREGMTADEILDVLSGSDVLEDYDISINVERCFEKFREREKYWDIRIIDYIINNHTKKKLFYDLYHPVSEIYARITAQILKILGMNNTEVELPEKQNEYELPVYPEVARKLGLEFWKKEQILRQGSMFKLEDVVDFEAWVKEYISWCYERKMQI